jgi:hypothetical protein
MFIHPLTPKQLKTPLVTKIKAVVNVTTKKRGA